MFDLLTTKKRPQLSSTGDTFYTSRLRCLTLRCWFAVTGIYWSTVCRYQTFSCSVSASEIWGAEWRENYHPCKLPHLPIRGAPEMHFKLICCRCIFEFRVNQNAPRKSFHFMKKYSAKKSINTCSSPGLETTPGVSLRYLGQPWKIRHSRLSKPNNDKRHFEAPLFLCWIQFGCLCAYSTDIYFAEI